GWGGGGGGWGGGADRIAAEREVQEASARRGLVRDELLFAEALGPEGGEAAVRGAGHRVLVDADRGRKEAGDDVVRGGRGAGGHDHAAHRHRGEEAEIRADPAD